MRTFEETKHVCADRLTDIHILGQSDTKLVWGSDSNCWEMLKIETTNVYMTVILNVPSPLLNWDRDQALAVV